MDQWFRFNEEIDENAIAIDLSDAISNKSAFYLVSKRIIDVVGSLVGLILLSPLFLLVAILIKLDSKGPIIFKQIRIGKDSKRFYIYKFRSMKIDTPNLSTEEFINASDFTTRVGKFIRKTSIDELPQLVNILKGDMSIVGPRPVIEREIRLLELRKECNVDSILPGITGLAQISGRDNIDDYEKVKYDFEYLSKRNLVLDIKIIINTVLKVVKSEGIK
ncbi:sugar transferase [Romboutsia timonensis]|uniref:sugar transferase n=1 Tax=Romboutsia timonensis TaxID=1776391 RepID=UPI002A7621C9|nr:sugar transferase [Romboutsia timonensis]MDY3001331.1 sugar transferase [Romboutsia timonensis]MDY3960128.1 sugar transferase [Romboutsia timonensis]